MKFSFYKIVGGIYVLIGLALVLFTDRISYGALIIGLGFLTATLNKDK